MSITHESPEVQGVSRRSLLITGGGAGLLTLSLAACGADADTGTDGDTDYSTPPEGRPKEAPMLTEMVENGELPPLEERLPIEADRLVVEAPEFGVYGGIYQGAVLGQGDDPWLERMIAFEPMLRVDASLAESGLPGTFKDIEMNDAGDEYTIHMREGMRWSDGEPVTSDDVMFALEDVYFNEELNANPPGWLAVNNEPCVAERIDDYTVRLTYPEPKGGVIEEASRSATWWATNLLFFPKHYLEDFLPHLNDGAEELADEAGFGSWIDHWEDRLHWWNNPEKPVLYAWVITNQLNEGNVVVAERNPYYWKVDSDGAQLPFIDRLEFEVVQEEEVMLLKAVNGELDFHSRHFNQDANRPVLAEAREEGGFDFVTVESTAMNRMIIALNLNHSDEELREVFQNKDFRIGLSHAIDRQEIIDTVYQRQGEPWQAAPHPDSEFYDEEFATQYTEFDVDLAEQHLDDAGLTERDSDGFRLLPSGERLRFTIDVTTLFPEWTSAADMVTRFWEDVGVDARVNTLERTLFYDRKTPEANEFDASIWAGDGGLHVEMLEPRWYFPNGNESNYAVRWADWYESRGEGDSAEEPPEATKRQMELAREIPLEPDEEEQKEIFREILEIAKEEFYAIGIALPTDGYGIVKNDLRNVVESFPDSWLHLTPGPVDIPTWFFDR
ncbi:ABC transporter substrate-binding protein [Nesterenkonia xinjiangensis]|uniref:Peptide/nickel transport system substrate-binding protein n=1 Tax=Nesterenkonia xinjiangensis TaxID=225327 RepID=A0A7Z0GLF5_9MICC|nr:ABC transporter substrate-binding protein [Nesterenkonia xinjiangensis]NYJ77903.1 peptide/nickel transport system substrate-binding protein [Nesterenkonia xinjiangensis]